MIVISKEFWTVNDAKRGTSEELPDKIKETLDSFHKFFLHT